jgi:hypothetical protein
MVTIHHLDVRFEVEGDEDRQQFASLFKEFIGRWSAEYEREKARERESISERRLGDDPSGGTTA